MVSGRPSGVDACSQAGKLEGDWDFGSAHTERGVNSVGLEQSDPT